MRQLTLKVLLTLKQGSLNLGQFLLTIAFFLKNYFSILWDIETGKYSKGKWVRFKENYLHYTDYHENLGYIRVPKFKKDKNYKVIDSVKNSKFSIYLRIKSDYGDEDWVMISPVKQIAMPIIFSDEMNDLCTMGYRNG